MSPLHGTWWCPVHPNPIPLMLFWSSWWWTSHKTEFNRLIHVQTMWEPPGASPGGDKFDTVSCNRLWTCRATWIMSPVARPQEWAWGSFGSPWWMITPPQLSLTWMSCGCGLSRGGGFTAEPGGVREEGCSLPLTRGYSTHPKLSSSPWLRGSECKPGFSRWVCELWPPPPWTQAEMIFRTAAGFGFLVYTFVSLSLVYFSLDPR